MGIVEPDIDPEDIKEYKEDMKKEKKKDLGNWRI
jgi:hypothetical protein